VTARLIIRFLLPVAINQPATIRAWIREYEPPLYVLEAELEQKGRMLVRASAKFIDCATIRTGAK
jgi:acyl-CoA thioesterase FadM